MERDYVLKKFSQRVEVPSSSGKKACVGTVISEMVRSVGPSGPLL